MRAMILAAGLGTRLKPLTDNTPKALIKINTYTLVELQIKKLMSEGFENIIINVHHFAEEIKSFFHQNKYFGCSIEFSDESELLLETGGGLKKASSFFSDGKPFLVYNVDIFSSINLKELLNYHLHSKSIATLAIQDRKSSRKFLFDNHKILSGWRDDATGKKILARESETELIPFAFSGVQIIEPKIFRHFPDKNIFSLVELYLSAAKFEKISGYLHEGDILIDLGKKKNLVEAEKILNSVRNIYPV